jgi:hypothetical protein
MKTKNPDDIKEGNKVMLWETGFEYVVTYTTEKSIKIIKDKEDVWIPKCIIYIYDSLLSTHGYRLFKFKDLPEWFVTKNKI